MQKARSGFRSEVHEALPPEVNKNDIANAAEEIQESENDELEELHLNGKTLLANKAAQKASVEESFEIKNTDDEAPPEEEKPRASLADRKIEADDDDWLDDQPEPAQKPKEEKKTEAI